MNRFHITRIWALVIFLAIADTCVFAADPHSESILGKWLVTRVGKHAVTELSARIEWEFTEEEVVVGDLTSTQEISRNRYTIDTSQNPKWITAIEVTNTYPGGYWEKKGFPWFAGI